MKLYGADGLVHEWGHDSRGWIAMCWWRTMDLRVDRGRYAGQMLTCFWCIVGRKKL